MTKAWIVALLLCACGGTDDGDDSVSPDGGGMIPGEARMTATLTYADGRVVSLDAATKFSLSAGYCSCSGSADNVSVSVSWQATRVDAVGSYPFTNGTTIVVNESHPFAKYSASDGVFELTSIDEDGSLTGTFEVPDVGLSSWPTGMPPDENVQLQSVTGGSVRCEGRADNPYSTCWH
jgi:hypothetical protein